MTISINNCRCLVVAGFLIGLISLQQTVGHIGDEAFLLISGNQLVTEQILEEYGGEADDYIESLSGEQRAVSYTLSNGVSFTGVVAEENSEHIWYHLFREANGDVIAMIVILILMFMPADSRDRRSWWIMMIILAGYYSPFWTARFIDSGMTAPHLVAELVHLIMAILPILGVFFARKYYFQ